MGCCCCPPAITALFYLWVRSGFSKDAVAGALVFFPPNPPLYKFKRIAKNGDVLPDIDEEEDDAENGGAEESKNEEENVVDDACSLRSFVVNSDDD
eukprot:scaffold14363_cov46-Skeletonema_menzelii.AAC.1